MKTVFILFAFFVFFFSCKKEMPATKLTGNDVSNSVQTIGPVRTPKVVLAATTKTQFIANADGNGSTGFTLSFASKKPGIEIVSFTFLAYETDSSDALSIFAQGGNPGFFSPTRYYAPAKAKAEIHGTDVKLPDDGSSVPVSFTIHYNVPSAISEVKSGDAVSIQLIAVEYINKTSPYILFESVASPLSPEIMITGSKPSLGLNIYDPDILHIGLTRIFETEYDSQGGSLGINNLPLVIKTTNTKIRTELVVKNETHTLNTTTVRNGNNYTIQFPAGYKLNGANVHDFFVYAHVYEINGQASIDTYLQPPSKFSWTDIAGGRTTPYTTENATYYYNYPNDAITVTHN